jgi:hypothetical protein
MQAASLHEGKQESAHSEQQQPCIPLRDGLNDPDSDDRGEGQKDGSGKNQFHASKASAKTRRSKPRADSLLLLAVALG